METLQMVKTAPPNEKLHDTQAAQSLDMFLQLSCRWTIQDMSNSPWTCAIHWLNAPPWQKVEVFKRDDLHIGGARARQRLFSDPEDPISCAVDPPTIHPVSETNAKLTTSVRIRPVLEITRALPCNKSLA